MIKLTVYPVIARLVHVLVNHNGMEHYVKMMLMNVLIQVCTRVRILKCVIIQKETTHVYVLRIMYSRVVTVFVLLDMKLRIMLVWVSTVVFGF